MGLFLKQNQERSELQEKIAAELQEKARRAAVQTAPTDGVDESNYIEGTKKTTSLALVWLVLIALAVIVVLWLIIAGARQG